MTRRVNNLKELGRVIEKGEPEEVLYDLGSGEKRTELLVTYMGGDNGVNYRTASSPLISIRRDRGNSLIGIEGLDENGARYAHTDLKSCGARYEPSTEGSDDLGTLVVFDEGDRDILALAQYKRPE